MEKCLNFLHWDHLQGISHHYLERLLSCVGIVMNSLTCVGLMHQDELLHRLPSLFVLSGHGEDFLRTSWHMHQLFSFWVELLSALLNWKNRGFINFSWRLVDTGHRQWIHDFIIHWAEIILRGEWPLENRVVIYHDYFTVANGGSLVTDYYCGFTQCPSYI